MGHRITFQGFSSRFGDIFSAAEASDLVELFYRWGSATFVISADEAPRGENGKHSWDGVSKVHRINLSLENIKETFRIRGRLGGNGAAPSLRMAIAMVLTHELQHANQVHDHGPGDRTFYGIRTSSRDVAYNKRPCERDARRFVDENIRVIAEVVGYKMAPRSSRPSTKVEQHPNLEEVADSIEEAGVAEVKDVVAQLRSFGMNNPKNVERVVAILSSRGFVVGT